MKKWAAAALEPLFTLGLNLQVRYEKKNVLNSIQLLSLICKHIPVLKLCMCFFQPGQMTSQERWSMRGATRCRVVWCCTGRSRSCQMESSWCMRSSFVWGLRWVRMCVIEELLRHILGRIKTCKNTQVLRRIIFVANLCATHFFPLSVRQTRVCVTTALPWAQRSTADQPRIRELLCSCACHFSCRKWLLDRECVFLCAATKTYATHVHMHK